MEEIRAPAASRHDSPCTQCDEEPPSVPNVSNVLSPQNSPPAHSPQSDVPPAPTVSVTDHINSTLPLVPYVSNVPSVSSVPSPQSSPPAHLLQNAVPSVPNISNVPNIPSVPS